MRIKTHQLTHSLRDGKPGGERRKEIEGRMRDEDESQSFIPSDSMTDSAIDSREEKNYMQKREYIPFHFGDKNK